MSDQPTGAKRYGTGGGDAYYDAVRFGGYEGTREQFGKDQAEFAENAQAVAEAKETVIAAEQHVVQIEETFTNETVPAAIESIENKGTEQVQLVGEEGDEAAQAIVVVGNEQTERVTHEGDTQVARVQEAKAAAVTDVEQAGETQIGNVNTAGTTNIEAVEAAGTAQVGAVNSAGSAQIQAVQQKGEEVLDSIPADYTELSGEVDDLKSALDSTVLEIGITASPIAWESGSINGSGGGVQANAKRIRTNAFEKGDIYSITPSTGYRMELAAYDTESNNSYVGMWDGATFVKTAKFTGAEIIMIDLPETYIYKIVLDYTEEIDASAYINCIVKYTVYSKKADINSEEWDDAYKMAKSLQSGLMPNLQMEKGTLGSSGQRVSSTTTCRTTTAVSFPVDTFVRCSDSEFSFGIREYAGPEISADNYVAFIGSFEGTYRLIAGKYYVLTVKKRNDDVIDTPENYSSKIEVWSPMYLETMRKYELKNFAPFGNSKRKIFAHKGITSNAPENTVPSFEAAGVGGAWGIETDIQATSDGYLICMHDTTVDRTTDGTGTVANMTMAQIDSLRIKGHPELKVPTLEQFLSICKVYGCVPCLELKNVASSQEMISKLIQTVSDYGLESIATVLCSQYSIGYVQCVNPKIRCIFIIDPTDLATWIPRTKRYFNTSVTMESGTYTITHDIIKQLHDAGFSVNVGGVNTAEEIQAYFGMGADSVSSGFIATY